MNKYKRAGDPHLWNFGWGNRRPTLAVKNTLRHKYKSFSSMKTMDQRFSQFLVFYEETIGPLKDIRFVELENVVDYAMQLKGSVEKGVLGIATAHHYLSAVNVVLSCMSGNDDLSVYPSDVGIGKRRRVAMQSKAATKCVASVKTELDAFILLCEKIGTRFEETSKLQVHKALKQALEVGTIKLERGTKGGRKRVVPISDNDQIAALKTACSLLPKQACFIPDGESYAVFRDRMYRINSYQNFHSYRHLYAQRRYFALVGTDCPVVLAMTKQKQKRLISESRAISSEQAQALDYQARLQIAEELGHSRVDITGAYLG